MRYFFDLCENQIALFEIDFLNFYFDISYVIIYTEQENSYKNQSNICFTWLCYSFILTLVFVLFLLLFKKQRG